MENKLLTLTSIDQRFALLAPKDVPVPEDFEQVITSDVRDVKNFLLSLPNERTLAMDWETKGNQIFGNQEFRAVGLSFAHRGKGIYINLERNSRAGIAGLITHIRAICKSKRLKLIAHNLYFDSAVTSFYCPGLIHDKGAYFWDDGIYHMCTYLMLRYLASENFQGQAWNLKWAQTELLGWAETNELDRDNWLIANGYITGSNKVLDSDSPEVRRNKLAKIADGISQGKQYKPDKSEMWRTPADILGRYCILDSLSCLLLYEDVLLPAFRKYETPFYKFFLYDVCMEWIRGGTVSYQSGIRIDIDCVKAYKGKLETEIEILTRKLYREYRSEISEVNKRLLSKFDLKCKPAKMETAVKIKLGKEPSRLNKKGAISKTWLKWKLKEKRSRMEAPELSRNYVKYVARRKQLIRHGRSYELSKTSPYADYLFNPASTDQKRDVLYSGVKYTLETDKNGKTFIRLANGIELDLTESGKLPTDRAAVLAIKGEGSVFNKITKAVKSLQFAESCIAKLLESGSGRLHLPMKYPGTLTNRGSGAGGINLQNQPKAAEFLRAWQADTAEGYFILQADWAAIEPHVLAESSRDKTLYKLYGPGAKKQDLYIFNAILMGGSLGRPFVESGYDIDNPTKEAMEVCKKKYKGLRNVSKCVTLCIAEGTLIRVQNKGLIPIQDVTVYDKVWDGDEWVSTSGAIYSGENPVILLENVYMTRQHNVLTTNGWKKANELFNTISERAYTTQCVRPNQISSNWADVWAMANYIARGKSRKWVSICSGAMYRMWDILRKAL